MLSSIQILYGLLYCYLQSAYTCWEVRVIRDTNQNELLLEKHVLQVNHGHSKLEEAVIDLYILIQLFCKIL